MRNNKNYYNEAFSKIVVIVFKDITENIFKRRNESPENTNQKQILHRNLLICIFEQKHENGQ